MTEDALVVSEFEAVNVIESLSEAFGTDLEIFQRRIEFELEENLLGVGQNFGKIFHEITSATIITKKIAAAGDVEEQRAKFVLMDFYRL